MERIILYSESQACLPAALRELPALSGHQVVGVPSRLELARAVIGPGPVLAVVVSCDAPDEGLQRLLASLKRSFPLLNLCLVGPCEDRGAAEAASAGWTRIDSRQTPEALGQAVQGFLAAIRRVDRREHARFDWPLQGCLGLPGVEEAQWPAHAIWALSADGAFLESAATPPAGTRATLAIVFQNSRLTTACEVLDPRRASSRLPSGFAVRFLELPEASRQILDHLVQDALLATLLEAGPGQASIPSLGEEELSMGGFQPL